MGSKKDLGTVKLTLQGRNIIKTYDGWIPYAVYVAMNNPDICGTWIEGCEVHHINGVKSDDRPENLICLSKYEHHQIHTRPVDAFLCGRYIGRFSSYTEASRELNVPVAAISFYLLKGKPYTSTYKDYRFSNIV